MDRRPVAPARRLRMSIGTDAPVCAELPLSAAMRRVRHAVADRSGKSGLRSLPDANRASVRAALHQVRDAAGREPAGWRPPMRAIRPVAAEIPRRPRGGALSRERRGSRGGTLASIIRRHKYGLDQSLGRALAECLGPDLPIRREDYDLVIPVPFHPRRLRWRGFNQAALLAAEVARRLDCAVDVTTLTRIRHTPPQTAQDLDTRRRNVRRAFVVRRPRAVSNRRVLLVDDVMTTGATANECARTLLDAGARAVDVFTLARVL